MCRFLRLSGEGKCSLAAYRSGPVSMCLSWLFSNFCSHPAGPLSDDSRLFLPLFILLPLLAQYSLVHISPFFISTSLCLCLRCTVSCRGHKEGHRAAQLYVYLSHSCCLLPPLFQLSLVVICITWPHVPGTSASLSWAVILEWLISQRVKETEFQWRCIGGECLVAILSDC